MAFSETITYDTAGSLNFNTSLVQVSGGAVTLKSPFTLTSPIVTTQHRNTISSITSFTEVSTKPANTSITYQLVLSGVAYYFNTNISSSSYNHWVLADGTSATSNSASVINANLATLFDPLYSTLSAPQFLSVNIFLTTTNVSNAPILTSNTIAYTWANGTTASINQCAISASLSDLNANVGTGQSAQLLVGAPYGFFHGTRFIEPFTKAYSFDVNGNLSASVIETATPGIPLKFALTYNDGQSRKTAQLFNAIVPNVAQINLCNLTTVCPYDFG